jgi:hypothetical protein
MKNEIKKTREALEKSLVPIINISAFFLLLDLLEKQSDKIEDLAQANANLANEIQVLLIKDKLRGG